MELERGMVTYVEEVLDGSVLAADTTAADEILQLEDLVDFDEDGGRASVEGVGEVAYLSLDDAASTIKLSAPIGAAVTAGARVDVVPAAIERLAHIRVDDVDDEGGDPILARIPHALWDRMAVGMREENEKEWVSFRFDGETYVVVDLVGREPLVDGRYIEAATLPPPATSDGDPPASSPAPTVSGGLGYLAVRWPAVANADPVTYEVHVSTIDGFAAAEATKVGEVAGTLAFVRALPDGSALAYGTTYYVRLVARDADGAAPAGAQASAAMQQVTTEDIAAGAITAAEILAGEVTAEKLASVISIANVFRAGSEAGQHVDMDPSGIRVIGADGATLGSWPTAGNPFFRAVIEALGLDVTGDAVFRGAGNSLAGSARLELSGGRPPDPSTAPSVAWIWDEPNMPSAANTVNRWGLAFYPGGDAGAGSWLVVEDLVDGYIREYSRDFTTLLRSKQLPAGYRGKGIAYQTDSTNLWVLGYGTSYYLMRYDLTTLNFASFGSALALESNAGLGGLTYSHNDASMGQSVLIVNSTTLAGYIQQQFFSTGRADLGSAVYVGTGDDLGGAGGDVYGCLALNGKYWFAVKDVTPGAAFTYYVRVYSITTGARDAASDFPLPGARYGLATDGTVGFSGEIFPVSMARTQKVTKHTAGWINPAGTQFNVRYGWRKSSAPAAETALSPTTTTIVTPRSTLRVTLPVRPALSGIDETRVWVKRAIDTAFELQGGFAGTVADLNAYTTANADVAPTASTFTGGAAAEIVSGSGEVLVNGAGLVGGSKQTVVFTASGTFVKANYLWAKYVRVRVVAGGGGGGGAAGAASGQGAGGHGGGGGYAEKLIPLANLAASEAVTVGAGGTGGAAAAGTGGTGGASSFGAHCSANGGIGGNGGSATVGSATESGGSGGTATGGDVNIRGSAGGNAAVKDGTNLRQGVSGASQLGGSVRPSNSSSSAGTAGELYGGGGSGANSATVSNAGGAGAAGIVIVEVW